MNINTHVSVWAYVSISQFNYFDFVDVFIQLSGRYSRTKCSNVDSDLLPIRTLGKQQCYWKVCRGSKLSGRFNCMPISKVNSAFYKSSQRKTCRYVRKKRKEMIDRHYFYCLCFRFKISYNKHSNLMILIITFKNYESKDFNCQYLLKILELKNEKIGC